MPAEARRTLTEPETLRALAHPVRLELMNHLMAAGPATASECARAVGDTPSNCSYHLRMLARAGLVEPDESGDARERPWRATITGFDSRPDTPDREQAAASAELAAIMLQREHRLTREYLARRDRVDARWRDADAFVNYTLRLSPVELRDLGERLDAAIRPYLAATRDETVDDSALVHLGLYAFPQDRP